MRRIVTAAEQYACRQHLADSTSSAASGGDDPGACDPMKENCGTSDKSDTAGSTPGGSAPKEIVPSAGSNSPGFYDYHAPTGGGISTETGVHGPGASGASAAEPVSFSPGAGVKQWESDVEQGLQRNGLPTSLAPQVEKQMQTESSGNPNAINNWDSNAVAGHPSQGLLQTIPSTFNTYHLPGDSTNIDDPQANIDSAIGYAKSRYGPSLMNGQGQGMGSGHGY